MNDGFKAEIYQAALNAWGLPAQLAMLAEEASELSVAALHCLRDAKEKRAAIRDLVDEMADTQIMIEQLAQALDVEDSVERVVRFKLERLRGRIPGSSKTRYLVTCPKCERRVETYWDDYPPGGVAPVECPCGYLILSESEGDPERIEDADQN